MIRTRDGGQTTVEYLGVLILVAAIIAAVVQLDVPGQLRGGVEDEVERVTDDPDAVTGDLELISLPGLLGPGEIPDGPVSLTQVRGITVNSSIASQLAAMLAAAANDGVHLSGGGWRPPDAQIRLRRAHCGTSYYAIYEMPSSQCTPPTARPGTSMHEQGLAIDFTCDGVLIVSRGSHCFQWLAANAAAYGFFNLPSEPWHWSINGR